jgi:predicted MPP superfamily phosphohydrolase
MLSRRVAFWFCAAASVVLAFYGYFEALHIHTDHVVIQSPKIPAAIGKIRIVQISDVHLGIMVRESRLRSILRKAAAEKPDILVSTGDLVDGQIDDISGMAGLFRSIDAPYGKFAVTGNHEYYAGIERAVAFTEQAGFTLLRGDKRDVRGIMSVVGVEDPAAGRFTDVSTRSEDLLFSSETDSRFVLLLKHRPVLNPRSAGRFDLQLSGHAHKGQIFPFSLIIRALYPIDAGLLSLPRDGFLYVSRGSGTWGPPMRILAPPEVTVIDLIPK